MPFYDDPEIIAEALERAVEDARVAAARIRAELVSAEEANRLWQELDRQMLS